MLQLSGQSMGEADLRGALLATTQAARICIKATLAYDQRWPRFGFSSSRLHLAAKVWLLKQQIAFG